MITGNKKFSLILASFCAPVLICLEIRPTTPIYISSVLGASPNWWFQVLKPISLQKISDGHSDPFGSGQVNIVGDTVLYEGVMVLRK